MGKREKIQAFDSVQNIMSGLSEISFFWAFFKGLLLRVTDTRNKCYFDFFGHKAQSIKKKKGPEGLVAPINGFRDKRLTNLSIYRHFAGK